jgi:NAD+ synthase
MAPEARRVSEGTAVDLSMNTVTVEEILTGFIATETRRTGLERMVIGLSGGLDSAVAATLAARALGPGKVIGILMPYRTSSPASLADARRMVDRLRIRHEEIEIASMVDPYLLRFPRAGRVRRGNRMARERMSVLYDRSAVHGALVLGTGNKTELLLGYGTLFGDMASAINPLGDLYKTQVRELAKHLKVPLGIRRKPPTADLWVGQTDEAEVGAPYEVVDQILCLLFDHWMEIGEVVEAGFNRSLVKRLHRTVAATQFKRRPPVVAKLSTRTVGFDFRYPRDWGT